ncbi:FAS-associated factor 1 isoform X2 [Culicoides brevitarsis]|uniref:FAS-associated factor 1 isoform X2 n=1 Tax=Culicoides brevitarsis TaxID=469753 RepID=UPI00307BFBB3
MSENREEILANFQSITAIDDVAVAIYHLEENDWDLLTAVNNVLGSQDVPPPPQMPAPIPMDLEQSGNSGAGDVLITAPSSPYRHPTNPATLFNNAASAFSAFGAGPSTSRGTSTSFGNGETKNLEDQETQEITFNVHFNGRVYKIPISNTRTIADLKNEVQTATGVQVCRQALKGWADNVQRNAQKSNTVLKTLHLEKQTDVILTDLSGEGFLSDMSNGLNNGTRPENQIYTLNITIKATGELKQLKFHGNQTILAVKTDVYTVTDIQVRHQKWIGWPNGVSNSMILADTGIGIEHNFTLESTRDVRNESGSSHNTTGGNVVEIDSESEEFEDAEGFDDDIFTDTVTSSRNRLKNLIPDKVDDETVGCMEFIQNYEERYGIQHPVFFQGSLEEAVKEACQKSARERKLLAIYLHHDGSVLTNVFCGQLLGHESIVTMFLDNFVVYGWDLTNEHNKNLFLTSISICVNQAAASTVRSIPTEHMPTILLVAKNRSQCEIFSVIHGNIGLDDLYSSLIEARESYAEQMRIEIREEDERLERERVKMEQDEAYQESLSADRAKEEARKQKELMMATERSRLESERAEILARKESVRQEAERALPPEPEQLSGPEITKIRIRTTDGMIERRFLATDTLQTLLNYVTSKGFPVDEYKLICTFPKRELTGMDVTKSLKELKLYPQETCILEER